MTKHPTTAVTQIGDALTARIRQGEFAGGRLPSERTLSEQFSTTRITLREALTLMESQGIIYRELRRGWFISPPRLSYNPLHRSHFHEMAEKQGRRAQTDVLDAGVIPAVAAVARHLEVAEGTEIYCIRRLRRLDGRAVLYVEHYLNPAYFPDLLSGDLTQSLTNYYLSQYGIRYGRVRFTMLPTPLPSVAAPVLKLAPGSPALFITRINRDQHDRIIDCDYEYWRYDALYIDVEA
ncbi:transcriptional regulator, GntR family [Dickeya chrysanthemi Ech1591]|uniref:Transcriptional regulator, GntR family n=1 Tax=Dickeya chrysanthemi (strain Ech1591) TaxID=561229 RepID=C6CKV4_DICC1|nr:MULTISPECIES: UTRA domain-containing protein [Dickeya]ACT05604.1 transcriptional regulator, GntR family [Dickeya chrysanthemi Ech1591]TYL42652.1 UTRA domain-containing protein [Dickeya sp. ws52]WJM85086.1 UTRA domain-containing protein [Dickeya chrysanthemi]